MQKELEKNLVESYPVIFQDYGGDARKTCMAWGIACGDGWYLLINDMCQKIMDTIGEHDIQVIATQVKEKFGGLRFYYVVIFKPSIFNKVSRKIRHLFFKMKLGRQYWKLVDFRKKHFYKTTIEKISNIVEETEMKSYEICERCGNPGKRIDGSWVVTLCSSCHKKLSGD